MNKKVIAMAVTAALAAPLAAQASDLTVSGRVGGDLTNSTSGNGFSDSGQSRVQFDAKDASGWYARIAFDMRQDHYAERRDSFIGTSVGGGKLQFGRMANTGANLEKDAFIATFLQLRGGAVDTGKYGSGSFIDANINYTTNLGGAKLGVDYILDDVVAHGADTGHYGLALSGKAGSMYYYLGMNNGDGSAATTGGVTKAGIKMPLGGMNLAVGYDSVDDAAKTAKMHLGVDMKMGGGMLDVTFADKGKDNTNSFYRIAFMKKASDSVEWHAGLSQNGFASNDQAIGAGVTVKF